jgi:hypothetical protein
MVTYLNDAIMREAGVFRVRVNQRKDMKFARKIPTAWNYVNNTSSMWSHAVHILSEHVALYVYIIYL